MLIATVMSIALVYVLPGFSTSAAQVPAESYPAEFHKRIVINPLIDASSTRYSLIRRTEEEPLGKLTVARRV